MPPAKNTYKNTYSRKDARKDMLQTTLRRSQLERRLRALGGVFAPFGADSSIAVSFKRGSKKDSGAAVARDGAGGGTGGGTGAGTGVLLCDLSPLSRLGLKGAAMPAVLESARIALPAKVNEASKQRDGSLCLRIAENEVLLLSALASDGVADFRALHKVLAEHGGRGCLLVPYQDSFCWLALAGVGVGEMFAKLCAVDLREGIFAPLMIAQTSLARLGAVIVRAPASSKSKEAMPLFHILCDNASSGYLWDCLEDAMGEYRGAVVARAELLKLV